MQMDFWQFSRNADLCVIPGKSLEIHLDARSVSNPQGKVLIIVGISCSSDLRVQHRRPCLNELQKEYCVKTKVIVLDWQWVPLRSRCQMIRNCHSSPVKNKVEGKPHKILKKLKIMSGKSTLFGHFFVKYFRSPVFISVFLLIQMMLPLYFTHAWLCVDLVFALLLDILWFCFGFGSCKGIKKKQESQVGFKER